MTEDFLAPEATQIRDLIGSRENKAARVAVATALESKFEGLQSLAAQVLGSWRSEQSKHRLRLWLEEKLRQGSSALVGVATQALRSRVVPEDASWLLDLYFSTPDLLDRHHLLNAIDVLPPACLNKRLRLELASPDPKLREAAVVLRNRLAARSNRPAHQ